MQRVTVITEEKEIVIEHVIKTEIDIAFDMFENEIKISTENKIHKFKEYQILKITIENE